MQCIDVAHCRVCDEQHTVEVEDLDLPSTYVRSECDEQSESWQFALIAQIVLCSRSGYRLSRSAAVGGMRWKAMAATSEVVDPVPGESLSYDERACFVLQCFDSICSSGWSFQWWLCWWWGWMCVCCVCVCVCVCV